MNRYTRQIRLRDVGAEGQARLEAATITPSCTGLAREIEEIYLRNAGVKVETQVSGAQPGDGAAETRVSGAQPGEGAGRDVVIGLRHAAAREVADGALAALVAIRAVLRGAEADADSTSARARANGGGA
jgi:hypothetical protein